MTQEWRVLATWPRPNSTDDDALDELIAALPGNGRSVRIDADRMCAEMTVEAPTALQAATMAACATADEPTELRVLPAEQHLREITAPGQMDLVGLHEVAEIIGRTKQRAGQLAQQPGFPAPVAELRSGPVWTRASIDCWRETWTPQTGRPRAT